MREPSVRFDVDLARTAALGLGADQVLDAAARSDVADASTTGDLPLRDDVRLSDVAMIVASTRPT